MDGIIIACYKKDFYLTRTCVASIRYFYPNIPVFLIKDKMAGEFDTGELEKSWNVKTLNLPYDKFGWGLSKLEPLFFDNKLKYLIIDSDVVFIGKVLDKLETSQADFIVSGDIHSDLHSEWMKQTYFDAEKLVQFDSSYQYPGFVFNTGNLVVRSGMLNRQDFFNVVDWSSTVPKLLHQDIFSCADQGVLNYMIGKKMVNHELRVESFKFMMWGHKDEIQDIDLKKIVDKSNTYPYLIHWAGTRHFLIKKMYRYDILDFFDTYYYSVLPFGKLKKNMRNIGREVEWNINKIKLKVTRRLKK